MGGGAGSSEETKYTVTLKLGKDLPKNGEQYIRYWEPAINPEPYEEQGEWKPLTDGTELKAGTPISKDFQHSTHGPIKGYYVDGEEIPLTDGVQSAFKMPAHNITIDVLYRLDYNPTSIPAYSFMEKPAHWKTITLDATPYKFSYYSFKDAKNHEESKYDIWVNPFYKTGTNIMGNHIFGAELLLPEGMKVLTDIDKIYTEDTVVKLEYEDPYEISVVLHKKDGTKAEVKTRKRSYEDIADEIRTNESTLSAGEKFVCWSSNSSDQDPIEANDTTKTINGDDICLRDRRFYDDSENSQEYKEIAFDEETKKIDLYEIVTKDRIVYDMGFYNYTLPVIGGKKKAGNKLSHISIVKNDKAVTFKDVFHELFSNPNDKREFNLYTASYETGELSQINFTDVVSEDCYTVIDLKEKETPEPGPGPGPGPEPEPNPGDEKTYVGTKRMIYVYSQPKLNYTKDANPTLDITTMLVYKNEAKFYQDSNGKLLPPIVSEETVPYENFKKEGILVEPAQGASLNALHNNKCIKVTLDGNCAYTAPMMTIKESDLYEPVYEEKTVNVDDDLESDIKFLDQNSTENPKSEASIQPKDYKVTADLMPPGSELLFIGLFKHKVFDYEGGQTIIVPVTITYKDGSIDKTQIVYHVNKENKEDSAVPKVNPIQEGSTEISGTGQPGAFIVVLIGNKYVGGVNVRDDGTWKIENIATDLLKAGAELRIVQTENNKAASSVNATVEENPNKHDSDRYETKATKIEKEFGAATTEDEVIAAVSVEKYPQDKTAPVITVDDPSKLPDGQTPGYFNVAVTVKYPDDSEDKLNVLVYVKEAEQSVETDADKYTAIAKNIEKEYGAATTEEEIKKAVKVADYPTDAEKQPEIKVDDPSKLPDGQTAGDFNVAVTVTYPDGTTDKVTVKVTVKAKAPTPEEKKDNEKYNPTVTNITKEFGEATTEEEIKKAVKVADYPQDKDAYTVTIDDASKLPDGKTAGEFDVAVTVRYPDGTTDKTTVKVTVKAKIVDPEENKDNEKYNPTATNITKNFGEATTEDEIKNAVKIADYPADAVKQPVITVDDPSKLPDGQTAGDFNVAVTVIYPDQSTDKVTVKVTVKAKIVDPEENKDNEKYNPTATNITKNFGEATTEEEVKAAVSVADYPQDKVAYTLTIDEGQTLPDGNTAGDFDVAVTVTYPDQSTDKVTVKVIVKAKEVTPEEKKDNEKNPAVAPKEKIEVEDTKALSPIEKEKVKDAVKKVNPKAKNIDVAEDGTVTIEYEDGSINKLKANQVVVKKVVTPTPTPNPDPDHGDDDYVPHRPYWPEDDYYRPYRPYIPNNDDRRVAEEEKEEKPAEKTTMTEIKAIATIGSKELEILINGISSKKTMDVAAQINNGRTMLPLRFVAEALGFKVMWISETRTVVIYDDEFKVEIPVDSNLIIVNGVSYESDVKPQLVNNRTLLPIANIARALGLKDGTDILWNPTTRQATVIRRIYSK